MSLTKVMIFFAIFLSSVLFWATSNVCRYNFVIDKKTIYFKELNCNNVEFSFNFERVLKNLETLSVMIYQELSTDIKGDPN